MHIKKLSKHFLQQQKPIKVIKRTFKLSLTFKKNQKYNYKWHKVVFYREVRNLYPN